jgi:hypothetical protein
MDYKEAAERNILGLIKFKGQVMAMDPGRLAQIPTKHIFPWNLLQKELIAHYRIGQSYMILYREEEGEFRKTFFAKNEEWFKAITSDDMFRMIRDLPQVFITGIS